MTRAEAKTISIISPGITIIYNRAVVWWGLRRRENSQVPSKHRKGK
jgi:hypothetical protein